MIREMKLVLAFIGLACVMTCAEAASSITYTVGKWKITLTELGPEGVDAFAINNRGEIAGWGSDSGGTWQRFIWDANTGAIIGKADNFDLSSIALPERRNENGEMAGTESINQNIYYGVYWNFSGRAFGLPPLAGPDPFYGSKHTKAHSINNLGQIAGAAKESGPTYYMHAVLWQNKDMPPLDLGFLGKGAYVDYSEAYGINDLGHVVGNSSLSTAIRGFLWRNGSMINLPSLTTGTMEGTNASAVNNNGLVAGKSNFYPVTWKYDVTNPNSIPVIKQLPIPSGFASATPTAISDSGDVTGYAGSPNIDAHAVLWRSGQAIDLGVWPGGHYSVAKGINKLGQIVGTGTIDSSTSRALLWTLVAADGGGTTNATPSASLRATTATSIRVGGSVSVQASFVDPDNGPWSYKLNWGDGAATTGNTPGAGTISGISSHVYTKTGSFKIKLTVTDSKGAVGSSSTITVRVR